MKYIDFINAKNALITSFGAIGGIFASAFGGWNTGLTTLVNLWRLITLRA